MQDAFFRLLVESGLVQWLPRRGFPFEVEAKAVTAARQLERLAHFSAKTIIQANRNNGGRSVALLPWQPRDERLTTAVALQLWGEFQQETTLAGELTTSLEASLFVITDLYPRPDAPEAVWNGGAPGVNLLSLLGWSTGPHSEPISHHLCLADVQETLDQGVKLGVWPEEALTHWNRFLFSHSLRQDGDAASPQAEQ